MADLDSRSNYEVGIEPLEASAGINPTDEEIIEKIKKREDKAKAHYKFLKDRTDINRKYWKGNQINEEDLYEGESAIIVNRIFQSIETLIPISIRKSPEPNVTISPRGKRSRLLQEKTGRYLKDQWEIHNKMKQQLQIGVRNELLSGYLFVKQYWDFEEKRVVYKVLSPGSVLFPDKYPTVDELPFVIEYVRSTLGKVLEKFPDKYDEIIKATNGQNLSVDSEITYQEYWENGEVAWRWKNVLLGSDKNPNYDFENLEANQWRKPRKPYSVLNFLNLGEGLADDTTVVEQVKSLQDNINKRKRQIDLNSEFANGKLVVAGKQISEANAQKIGKDTKTIYLDKAEQATGAIDILVGRGLDQESYADMNHSEQQIDNVIGVHGTTRGEQAASETATGRAMLKESDFGRIDLISSNIEQLAEELYENDIQLLRMFGNEKSQIHSLPEGMSEEKVSDKDRQTFILGEEYHGKRVTILVENGSTSPRDELVEKSEAVDLAKNQMMSLKDMYRILEYPDPESLARNAFLEVNAPELLYPEIGGFEKIEPQAIRHIMAIQNGEEFSLFSSEDPREYKRHVDTQNDFFKGVEIDEDLVPYEDMKIDNQEILIEHHKAEVEIMEQMSMRLAASQPQQLIQEQLTSAPAEEQVDPLSPQSEIPQEPVA